LSWQYIGRICHHGGSIHQVETSPHISACRWQIHLLQRCARGKEVPEVDESQVPAESGRVGLLASQGVGEQSMQMTLNMFHFSGHGATNVTRYPASARNRHDRFAEAKGSLDDYEGQARRVRRGRRAFLQAHELGRALAGH
ncbi:hypothetical protein HYPSUDRAFT_1090747, partial [Hypholoma sublateritium FD-334 SS-4]